MEINTPIDLWDVLKDNRYSNEENYNRAIELNKDGKLNSVFINTNIFSHYLSDDILIDYFGGEKVNRTDRLGLFYVIAIEKSNNGELKDELVNELYDYLDTLDYQTVESLLITTIYYSYIPLYLYGSYINDYTNLKDIENIFHYTTQRSNAFYVYSPYEELFRRIITYLYNKGEDILDVLIFIRRLERMINRMNGIYSLIPDILSQLDYSYDELARYIESGILFDKGITAALLLFAMETNKEKFKKIVDYYILYGINYKEILDMIIDYYATRLHGQGWEEIYPIVMYIIENGELSFGNIYENGSDSVKRFLDVIVLNQV